MDIFTTQWTAAGGWSTPLPPVDGPRTLVLVFAAPALADGVREVVGAYPTSIVAGCSTAGEILGEQLHDESVTVTIVRFASTRVTVEAVEVADASLSERCGRELGRRLRTAHPDLRGVFALSDGLRVNGSALAAGLAAAAGPGVTITGGLAGDGPRLESTWVLVAGEARSGWVVAIGLSGPELEIGHGFGGGWDIFGPERRVTRSSGNVLYELDGRPALGLYRTYLGERAEGLPANAMLFPLSIRVEGAHPLVRTIIAIDDATQAMTFAGDVPEGALSELMYANVERLIEGASRAAAAARIAADDDPALAIAVSCVGRRLALGQRTEEELEAVATSLPASTVLTGFYSYGELAPTGGTCALHNQTMTLTTLRERV